MRKPVQSFHERLTQLRTSAAIIYDRGIAKGLQPQEMTQSIEPLQKSLSQALEESVKEDLAGVLFSIRALEHQVEAFKKDAEFLLKKAADAQHHVDQMRRVVIADLKARKVASRVDQGFSVTLSRAGERDVLTVR